MSDREPTGEKLQRWGKGMQDTGKAITCGCFSLILVVILIFILLAVARS